MERKFDPSDVASALLEGEISDGMFSNEKCVVVLCHDGTKTSGFVDDSAIEDGRVVVRLIDAATPVQLGIGSDLVLIELPSEFYHGSRYVTVTSGQLQETKAMRARQERARKDLGEGRGITLDEYLRQRDRGETENTPCSEHGE